MANREGWDRVAGAVRARRLELGRTQQDMAEQATVSLATWRLVESSGRDRYQDLTVHGICRSLGWRTDAFELLLGGEVPMAELRADRAGGEADVEVPAGLARKWHDLSPAERSKVEGFIDGLMAGRQP